MLGLELEVRDPMVYLDYAAAHPLTPVAQQALTESWGWFANPSSPHALGREAKSRLSQCRQGLRELLSAKKTYDLIFTASATESNNMAILGQSLSTTDEVLFSEASHPSLLKPLAHTGAHLTPIPLEHGRVTPQSLSQVLSERTKLVLLDHVNSLTGLTCDIATCGELVGERAHVHVDASQSFTRLPLSLQHEAIDSLTLSAHKIGGPRGVAALLVKRYTVRPLLWGGGQEQGLRPGTENLPLAWAFYKCAQAGGDREHLRGLKQQLTQGLKARGALFPFEPTLTAPHICTFLYPHERASTLLSRLEQRGIFLAQTSACSSGKLQGQNPWSSLQVSACDAEHILRASLSFQSTTDDIQQFLQAL